MDADMNQVMRAYTLNELDTLRDMARDQLLSEKLLSGMWTSDREAQLRCNAAASEMIEDRVRTMMTAGIEPQKAPTDGK